ncbi:hypothetical protein IGB42_02700 [Andreprevotia sp. IGB-42]|uniref:phosphatase PAP2 family protein n=1 Tax=Andreprevotia sp. IGB-42 TaxID=2497473 RepID=UPI001359D75A|nr:phosphatase PAP2 family protein [Andreprevotia sp. IGB-42]KAF0812857.1 hypothetical protein IGB42_02700 [Andreprevotia sp. IGB-42]
MIPWLKRIASQQAARGLGGRFWLLHLGIPLLVALLMIYAYPASHLDTVLMAPYFDAASRQFPWRDQPLLAFGMHTGLKSLVVAIGVGVALLWVLSWHVLPLAAWRRSLLWLVAGLVASTTVISMLKSNSVHHCPWDVVDYGGYAPRLALFQSLPANISPGRCFPGGHASAGFALMAFYFALRERKPRPARRALLAGLALGMVMGWSQMMRGAHFFSHNVWSAWWVWMTLLALYAAWPPNQRKSSQT